MHNAHAKTENNPTPGHTLSQRKKEYVEQERKENTTTMIPIKN